MTAATDPSTVKSAVKDIVGEPAKRPSIGTKGLISPKAWSPEVSLFSRSLTLTDTSDTVLSGNA